MGVGMAACVQYTVRGEEFPPISWVPLPRRPLQSWGPRLSQGLCGDLGLGETGQELLVLLPGPRCPHTVQEGTTDLAQVAAGFIPRGLWGASMSFIGWTCKQEYYLKGATWLSFVNTSPRNTTIVDMLLFHIL